MADEQEQSVNHIQTVPPPVAYVDGIMSHAFASGMSKFYLYRSDPDPEAKGPASFIPVVQIVMSDQAFAETCEFMMRRLNTMVKNGALSKEVLDKARAAVS